MLGKTFKPKEVKDDYGWHSRKLPHLDGEQMAQFVTFRLADSMPQAVLDKWREECEDDVDFRKRIEKYLDAGYGSCWLGIPEVAKVVADAMKFFDGKRYELRAWVIMPNHGHMLIVLRPGEHLPGIMHSIKSYSAKEANKLLGRTGQFWQHESFDRYIRSRKHFVAVVKYIEENPVKAGLCSSPEGWKFSSAYKES
jgi:putative DNA methylase